VDANSRGRFVEGQHHGLAVFHAEPDQASGVGRIRSEGGALAHLKKLYNDPTMPTSVTLKAAGLAAPFETPKAPQTHIGFDVSSFANRLAAARRGEVIDVMPDDEADTGDAGDAV
jgi:hypothetical protein